MTQPYTEFRYFYPPRTEMKVEPTSGLVLPMWEKFPDAIGQFKLNGTRNMLYIYPDGRIECWNRGGKGKQPTQQKQYDLTLAQAAQIALLGLPRGKFHVLDGELLHSKTKNVKDILYMFDMLVFNGEHLIGQSYGARYSILQNLMMTAGLTYFPADFAPKDGRMYLAENFPANRWDWMWQTAQNIEFCEGMVLKRSGPISALEYGFREINNAGFMLRVRKPTKNYRH